MMNIKKIFWVTILLISGHIYGAELGRQVSVVRPNSLASKENIEENIISWFEEEGQRDSITKFKNRTAFGSGTLLEAPNGDWLIATNAHVVENAYDVNIEFPEFDGYKKLTFDEAPIVYRSRALDLALIRLPDSAKREQLWPFQLQKKVSQGEEVRAVGFPGLFGEPSWRVEEGEILQSRVNGFSFNVASNIIYEHSAKIDGGSSGGPLITTNSSALLGLNTWSVTSSNENEKETYFSITATTIEDALQKYVDSLAPEDENWKKEFDAQNQVFLNVINYDYEDEDGVYKIPKGDDKKQFILSQDLLDMESTLEDGWDQFGTYVRDISISGYRWISTSLSRGDAFSVLSTATLYNLNESVHKKKKNLTLVSTNFIKERHEIEAVYSYKKYNLYATWGLSESEWRIIKLDGNSRSASKLISLYEDKTYDFFSLEFVMADSDTFGLNLMRGWLAEDFPFLYSSGGLSILGPIFKMDDSSQKSIKNDDSLVSSGNFNWTIGLRIPLEMNSGKLKWLVTPYGFGSGILGRGGFKRETRAVGNVEKVVNYVSFFYGWEAGGGFEFSVSNDFNPTFPHRLGVYYKYRVTVPTESYETISTSYLDLITVYYKYSFD